MSDAANEAAPANEAPILDGPKPTESPAKPAEEVSPLDAERNLVTARAALKKSREDACAKEVEAVLERYGCVVAPRFAAQLVPAGQGPNGEQAMTTSIVFGGWDIRSR